MTRGLSGAGTSPSGAPPRGDGRTAGRAWRARAGRGRASPYDRTAAARRDLVVAAVAVVALSRLADGPAVWAVAALLAAAIVLGGLQLLAEATPPEEAPGVPIEALLTPAVAGLACVGAIRLVPLGLVLAPALLVAALLLDRTLRTEALLLAAARRPTESDRAVVLGQALVVGAVAFLGVAALVPGGLPEPGAAAAPMRESDLLLLAGADGLVAGVLGYRAAALRAPVLATALWSAATYAGAVAIAAAALRAMDLPRLMGPALLALVFFLWDAFHGAPPARRRDPRWLGQTALLVALGIVVVAWNLALR